MTEFERYAKQVRLSGVGREGQEKLAAASAVVIGAGALGSMISEQLVRAGLGSVRLIDRDFVELSNLQRQVMYTEADVADRTPKAVAAERHLNGINSSIHIEGVVADLTPANAVELCRDADILLDGTDNLETRYLLNDVALATGRPWVHGGCAGSHGQSMTVVPGETPCLRCVFPEPPPPGSLDTCDTAGVLGPAVHAVASVQSAAAIRLLVGSGTTGRLFSLDVWEGTARSVKLGAPSPECPACRGVYEWLDGTRVRPPVVLCGRNAVQITPAEGVRFDLDDQSTRLAGSGSVERNRFLLRWTPADRSDWSLTLFRDGRAIVQGTEDVAAARSFYADAVGG